MMTLSEVTQRNRASNSHFHRETTQERLRWELIANGFFSRDSGEVLRVQVRRNFEHLDRLPSFCGGFRTFVGLVNFGKGDITPRSFQNVTSALSISDSLVQD